MIDKIVRNTVTDVRQWRQKAKEQKAFHNGSFGESSDKPFDVTLVVKYGKQFKAHGNILSKASSFFEKISTATGRRVEKESSGLRY